MSSHAARPSVAGLMVIRPGVEVKPIKGDALIADGNLREVRPHLRVEAVAVHTEIKRRIAHPNETREQ